MRILIPLPSYGFDPTEVAVPWRLFTDEGMDVLFATPDGDSGTADRFMVTGNGLGVLKPFLRARSDAVEAYGEMLNDESFQNPFKYSVMQAADFDALYLPGGHDKTVREFLESELVQRLVVEFFSANKPVAAICHGVVVAARSIDPNTQKSVIHDYKTTALLKSQELAAYNLTRLWMGDYYLTYPGMTVEDEVRGALSESENFLDGPKPLFRDSMENLGRGFFVKDRNYLSARWPGDVYTLSLEFMKMLARS